MALWILVIAAAILAGGTNLFVLMTNLITPIEQLLLGTAIYLVFMAIFVALTYCVLGAITEVPSCLPLIGAPLLALSGLVLNLVSLNAHWRRPLEEVADAVPLVSLAELEGAEDYVPTVVTGTRLNLDNLACYDLSLIHI